MRAQHVQFIKDLYLLQEKDDLSKLPENVIKSLKKLIRDGASDLELKWANSLELVKKAYEVEGVMLPSPAEKTGYEQFEELLSYAVAEMTDARKGTDDSWRMSSTVFREFKESMQKMIKVRVYEIGTKNAKGHTVEVQNMEQVIDMIRKQAGKKGYKMDVDEDDPSSCTCKFSYQGIQRPYKVRLQRL